MRSTDWDHSGWYHRLLLAQVPRDAVHVLDVGCGAGTLARRLAARTRHVDELNRSRRCSPRPPRQHRPI